ncbi:P27 family phage terminase small subunit [Bacillus thuringiensis]|uniref:P27 family phage terminase small subunit n=1 Tax=Bacillus thuringiensis TaxID=1428 RepID=UPI003D794442
MQRKSLGEIAGELLELDVITNIDVNALATYCDTYSDYVECTKLSEKKDFLLNIPIKAAETNKSSPSTTYKKKQLHEQMKALAVEFGLTPKCKSENCHSNSKQGPKTNVEKEFDV